MGTPNPSSPHQFRTHPPPHVLSGRPVGPVCYRRSIGDRRVQIHSTSRRFWSHSYPITRGWRFTPGSLKPAWNSPFQSESKDLLRGCGRESRRGCASMLSSASRGVAAYDRGPHDRGRRRRERQCRAGRRIHRFVAGSWTRACTCPVTRPASTLTPSSRRSLRTPPG